MDRNTLPQGTIILEPQELDQAILGITQDERLVYSYSKLIVAFALLYEWDEPTSQEWVDYNVVDAYLGDKTPIYVYDL